VGRGERRCKFFAEALEALCAYAEPVFRSSRKLDDGASQAEHQASAARQLAALGRKAAARQADPDLPAFPWALEHLWDLFLDLVIGVASNGMAPPVVTWRDVEAFDAAADLDLAPWEKRALVRLGNLRAMVLSEDLVKPKTKPGSK
jgi:hypothetical protein